MTNQKSKGSLWSMIKLGLVLVCYAAASCTVLAVVNNFTAPRILQNQINKANQAMKVVFENATSFESVTDFPKSTNSAITVSDFYLAKENDSVIGAVVQVSGPTYDKGKIIVGINVDGSVSGMQILELSDSPGFGLKANDPSFILAGSQKTFYGQFTGKNAKDGFMNGSNFDGISGATITSDAIGNLVHEGSLSILKYFEENLIGDKDE